MTAATNIKIGKRIAKSARRKWTPPQLPQFYYHNHFCDMLRFVQRRYDHVLGRDYRDVIPDFFTLSQSAQCVYARIASRKGFIFDTRKFSYPEIPDIERGLAELRRTGWIDHIRPDDQQAYFRAIAKTELVAILSDHLTADDFKPSWKKDRLVEIASERIPFEAMQIPEHFITQGQRPALRFICFLFFGKIEDNLQRFTLRDLGLIKVPDFKSDYSTRFDGAREAHSAFFYADALSVLKTGEADDLAALIDSLEAWPEADGDQAERAKEKLVFELGRICERHGDLDTALFIYGHSQSHDCTERIIRIRYQRGDTTWCQQALERLMDDPDSDEAHSFATDFYARKYKKKRTSALTDMLRDSEIIRLDEGLKHVPEYAIKRHFEKDGNIAAHAENAPWRMAFGLLFWEELFQSSNAGLYNPFDRTPSTLRSGEFYDMYQSRLEAKLERLADQKATQLKLLKAMTAHYGTPNGIFRWDRSVFETVKLLVMSASPNGVAEIFRQMAKSYMSMKDGFPDLICIADGTLRLVEVKAPGDVIRRNQLTRIRQLKAAGFAVDIARIEWEVSADQIYVVVDIETTGGKGGHHRITEIGAVKVYGGKVIDEFQTLLNPERHVPSFITRLTGITNDMVKDAPKFETIASEFRAFLGDAIFVAHNVNFDYGFIKAEYGRLGQTFRYPKLCTVTSMRKYYPGLKSYGLANLCREFSIDLTTHHRAMCDAKAAAKLLFLVNDKRASQACKSANR